MVQIAITPEIERLARMGAWFVFSVSGGKDSGASMHAACAWLDHVGHPRERRLALHADLGRAEWPDTLDTVRAVAAHCGVGVETVTQTHDLLWRFGDRWERSLQRYSNLETISLVAPWSSSSLLFCRSEQKEVPLCRRKAAIDTDLPIVGIVGLRRQESTRRASTPIATPDNALLRRNRREGILWHPIAGWTTEEVFAYHARHGIPLHRAYSLSMSRLSCAYCVLSSKSDVLVSAQHNRETLHAYASLEVRSAFSFQSAGWLADHADADVIRPADLVEAKAMAAERLRIHSTIPRELLRAKTIRNIGIEDASALADARANIADLYGITVIGTSAEEIMHLSKGI